ncbi:Pectinesterase inhibitor [Melia azedarach]|uniref:Pectinesterase inhibitor n=1 Tax=Melia azedarach TaxID=155640 RepID=A0ACC1YZ37_MELAZ|nr:Pectinesterase inhibitor [Melia azedarach]
MLQFSFFSYSSFCIFFFFLIVTPQVKPSIATAFSVDIINQTCKICAEESTFFSYSLCLASLQTIPVSHAANLQGLALIAMELALENATNTVSSIEKLLRSGGFDPFALACLKDCFKLYSDSVVTLIDATGAFLTGQYVSANVWLSAVMEATSTCEEGFTEKEGEVSPLTKENYNLFQLCDIALCIIHLLSLAVHS